MKDQQNIYMKLADDLTKECLVNLCIELEEKLGKPYKFAPIQDRYYGGIACTKWPKKRKFTIFDEEDDENHMVTTSEYLYIKYICFPVYHKEKTLWPSVVPKNWKTMWISEEEANDILLKKHNDTSNLWWDSTMHDGASWTDYEKRTIASIMQRMAVTKK